MDTTVYFFYIQFALRQVWKMVNILLMFHFYVLYSVHLYFPAVSSPKTSDQKGVRGHKMQYSTVLVLPSLKGKAAKGLSKNKNKNSRKSFFFNFVTKNFTFAEEA